MKKILWTQHSEIKMKQYGLSKNKILNIIRKPERVEQAIVLGATAMMKTNKVFSNASFKKSLRLPLKVKTNFTLQKQKKSPGEVWVMYKDTNPSTSSGQGARKIISAWRYPGVTKPGEQIPIPADIKAYLESSINFK